jgi:hypothetical protein
MFLKKNKKNKYYAIFVKREHGVFKRIGKKRISPMTEKVRRKKHTYFLDMSFPTYSRGLKVFYFINVSEGQLLAKSTEIKGVKGNNKVLKDKQILFKGSDKDAMMSPKTLDMLVSQNIVSQLTSNLSDSAIKMNIISIVLGLIIGALGGYIFAGYA